MTEAEIETELGALRARLAQLELADESRTEQWRQLGIEYKVYGLVFVACGAAFSLSYFWIQITVPMPMGLAFVMLGLLLGLLVRALRVAPARSASPDL
jgi:hypothetical protein